MSFKPYPSYRNSGIRRIGRVPAHWQTPRLKILARIRNGQDYKSVETEEAGYPVIGSGGAFAYATTYLHEGPSVLLGRKGTVDKPLLLREPFWTVDTMFYTELERTADPAFLYYSAKTIEFAALSTNTALPSMAQEDLANVYLAAPQREEQEQIATFLDHETAKIDALVAEQKRLIELLKEKRQAVISDAVTKGLDPNVPMKDSGVKWLGGIPDHWLLSKLKHLVDVTGGSTPSKERLDYWDGAIPWASPRDIKTDYLIDTFHHISEIALTENGNEIVPENTILVVVRGMILAHSFPVSVTSRPMTINQDLKALTPLPGADQAYLACLLSGIKQEVFHYIDSSAHGTRKLEWERFTNVDLPLPPIWEQRAIATWIERKTDNLNDLEDECSTLIAKLIERRSALIAAAVTGKIDVRDWQPPADGFAAESARQSAEANA